MSNALNKLKAFYIYDSLKFTDLTHSVDKECLLENVGGEPLITKALKLVARKNQVSRFLTKNEKAIDIDVLMQCDKLGIPAVSLIIENRLGVTQFLPKLMNNLEKRAFGPTTNGGEICAHTDKKALGTAGGIEFRKKLAMTPIEDNHVHEPKLCINYFADQLNETELVEILQDPFAFRSMVRAGCDNIHPRVMAKVPSEFFLVLPNPPILHLAKSGNLHLVPKQLITTYAMNLTDGLGRTILHHAARTGCVSAIPKEVITEETLMRKDARGRTPFMHAFVGAHENISGIPSVSASPLEEQFNRIINPAESLKTLLDFNIQLPDGSAPEAVRKCHNVQFVKSNLTQAQVVDEEIGLF